MNFIGNFVVFINHLRVEKYLESYTSWLSVRSIVDSHFLSLYYAKLADVFKKYPGHSLYSEVSEFLRCGLEDLYQYRNHYTDIWKTVPALAIGAILRDLEPIPCISFLESTLGEV